MEAIKEMRMSIYKHYSKIMRISETPQIGMGMIMSALSFELAIAIAKNVHDQMPNPYIAEEVEDSVFKALEFTLDRMQKETRNNAHRIMREFIKEDEEQTKAARGKVEEMLRKIKQET